MRVRALSIAAVSVVVAACSADHSGAELSDAIAATPPGATLQLDAGTYVLIDALVLDQGITIVGAEGGTTIAVRLDPDLGVEERIAIRVRTDDARLSGLKLTTEDDDATLVDVLAGVLELSNVGVTGGRVGVRFSPDGAGKVEFSRFEGSQFGLIVAGSSVVIEDSELTGHQEGIVFDVASTATARGNTISGSNNGILVQADARPLIVENTLAGNVGGIAFYEGATGTAIDNTVSDSQWGIDVRSPGPVSITGNDLVANEVAIQFWIDAGIGEVRDNTCADNGQDIVIAGPATPEVSDNACSTVTGPAHDPPG